MRYDFLGEQGQLLLDGGHSVDRLSRERLDQGGVRDRGDEVVDTGSLSSALIFAVTSSGVPENESRSASSGW